eukprot:SAG11_NODE_789_length_7139_cov_5.205607_7_plen_77_part_00
MYDIKIGTCTSCKSIVHNQASKGLICGVWYALMLFFAILAVFQGFFVVLPYMKLIAMRIGPFREWYDNFVCMMMHS